MHLYDWSAVEREQLNPLFARQVIYADSMTVARVFLKKGCLVPMHSHVNEQLSVMEQGEMQFIVDGKPVLVKAGQTLRIPSNVPHSAEALVDSVSLDVFSGIREDWRSGSDAYLRR